MLSLLKNIIKRHVKLWKKEIKHLKLRINYFRTKGWNRDCYHLDVKVQILFKLNHIKINYLNTSYQTNSYKK